MEATGRMDEDQLMLQAFFTPEELQRGAQATNMNEFPDSAEGLPRGAAPAPAEDKPWWATLVGQYDPSMLLDQQQQTQMQQQIQHQLYQQQQQQHLEQQHLEQQHLEQQQQQQQQQQQLQQHQQLQQLQQQQQQQQWASGGSGSMAAAPFAAAAAAADGGAAPSPALSGPGMAMYGNMQEALQRPAASSLTAARANSAAISSRNGGGGGGGAGAGALCSQSGLAEDEPDLSQLTVMQRYHARRKLAMQRMEREVEEKIAQLALLEQENRRLKWQAHILENMLLDIDKQLEVMSSSDAAPDASQWLTLLGMGQASAAHRVARTVHKMLEGASSVDVSSWSVQDCRHRWLAYLEALRPLVEAAEAAQAAHRAAQPQPAQEQTSTAVSRRPRRAAAAAAQAVIQQEAADVLGVAPLQTAASGGCGCIPEPPLPPSSSSPMAVVAAAVAGAPGGHQQEAGGSGGGSDHAAQQLQSAHSGCSSGEGGEARPAGSEGALPPAHAASVEGIPGPLLAQIEELVLTNFYWLLSMMSTHPVLTYEFISVDLMEGGQPLPPQEAALWSDAITRVQPSLEQLQECSSCIQVSRRCMAKVMAERAEIQGSMQCGLESEMHSHLADGMLQLNSRDTAVERMRANVRKESVVRNMVGFYCINVFSLFQLAQVSLACSPWFCMAWRVVGAVEERLEAQLAEAGRSSGRPGSTPHNTRNRTRQAGHR